MPLVPPRVPKVSVYIHESVRLNASRSRCPGCDSQIDAAAGLSFKPEREAAQPKPGDVTVCGYCGEILLFQPDYMMAKITPGELASMSKRQRRLIEEMSKMTKLNPLPRGDKYARRPPVPGVREKGR